MSWFSKNYEKAALGGAAVAALGLAYMGWSRFGSVESDFPSISATAGNNNVAVRTADLIPKASSSMKVDRSWTKALAGERPVDLFTGIPLFVASSEPEKAVDLLEKGGTPVHPPIPNIWWIDNRLDPGFGDSPARDPDQDGFSNLEEFNATTDPNDSKLFPSLIAKLMFVRDETLTWVIRPSYGSDGKFPFSYEDTKRATNKTGAANMVAPGELFFGAGAMANRFKLLGSEIRQVRNPRTKIDADVTIVRIEDQRPNKMGTIYEFPAPLSDDLKRDYLKYDRTAIFSLEALGLSGKEFKVEENTNFALPPDAPKKDYLLKAVMPDSVTVEYTDPQGKKSTVQIPKGATAKPEP